MAKDDKKVKRGVYLYIDGKEIKNDFASIDKEAKQLSRDIQQMQIGSEEYNRTMGKIKYLKGILADHKKSLREINSETKKSTLSFGKFVDGFNRFGGFIASMIASLTGVVLGLKALRDEKNKLEDSQASLQSLTGLDDSSIKWLTEQAEILSTTMTKEGLRVRKSADEILEAYTLVGSAKPELLGDKEALAAVTEEAMRLQAAAGDIKLNEAVDALTLSLNQYGQAADQAGRYTNVLAAGSKEGSANIASQTAAIRNAGVAAASANVSFEETVGLIQTLAYSGIKDEVAGTGLKKFFLVLQTGADNTNPKVVGLAKALENLKAQNLGAADVKKMFGEEGYNTASVILNHIDMVNRYTKAVTGTNIAYEQSSRNSATASAKIAQVRNEMKLAGIELINKINPAILVSTNAMTYVVKFLPTLIDWLKKWGGVIVVLSAELLIYNTRLKLVAAAHTAMKGWVASTVAARGAMALLTGHLGRAAAAWRLLNMVIKVSPWGMALAAINAIGVAIYALTRKTNEAKKAYKDFVTESSSALGEVKRLVTSINSANVGTKTRLDLINEFNQKYGQYLSNLLSEKSTVEDIAKAYAQVASGIKEKIAQETIDRHIAGIQSKAIEAQADKLDGIRAILSGKLADSDVNAHIQKIVSFTESQIAQGNSANNIAYGVGRALGKKGVFSVSDIGDIQLIMKEYAAMVKETNQQVKDVQNRLGVFIPKKADANPNELPEVVVTPGNKGGSSSGKPLTNDMIDAEYNRQQQELQRLYLEGQFETEQEFADARVDLELQTLNKKLKVAGIEESDRKKIQNKILEYQVKHNKQCIEEDKKLAKDRLTVRQRQLKLDIQNAEISHYENLTSEEDYLNTVKSLYDAYYKDVLSNYQLTEDERAKILEEQNQKEVDDSKRKYEEIKRQSEEYSRMTMDIASEFGTAIGEMIANGELSMKNFLRTTLMMALDTLERIITMTTLEITAKNMAATAPFSFIGAAKAAVQVAAIKAAFAVVKGIVANFYNGGFTPSGDWDKPQGVVHSDEFVANRFAVRNPNIRPVLNVIDYAQRTGNISRLTGDDIAAVVRTSTPAAAGSSSRRRSSEPKDKSYEEMNAMLSMLANVLGRLNRRLDDPFVTVNTVTGPHGMKEALDEYEKMNKNKSR